MTPQFRAMRVFLMIVAALLAGACDPVCDNGFLRHDDRWDDRPNDAVIVAWPLDMRLDVAIERIVELRGRAERGDTAAQARLGPVLDAEEAVLWRARQAARERTLALAEMAILRRLMASARKR